MKAIVVSGARSKVGKTQLSRALCKLLPGAVRIKIGHHPRKPDGDDYLYPIGTRFSTIAAAHSHARFLIIESNRILKEITPECAIYLPAENPKPSAEIATFFPAFIFIIFSGMMIRQFASLIERSTHDF